MKIADLVVDLSTKGGAKTISDIDKTKNALTATSIASYAAAGALAVLSAALVAGAAGALMSVQAFAKFEVQLMKFEKVFGNQSGAVRKWSQDFAKSLGYAKDEFLPFLANIQDMVVPLGFAREEATEFSKQALKVAVDLAAWSQGTKTVAETTEMMSKLLNGEANALETVGVKITETDLKQAALNARMDPEKLTQMQKATLLFALAQKKSSDATGFAAATSDTLSGKWDRLVSKTMELSKNIGEQLTPGAKDLVDSFVSIIDSTNKWVETNPALLTGLSEMASKVADAVKWWGEIALWIGKATDKVADFLVVNQKMIKQVGYIATGGLGYLVDVATQKDTGSKQTVNQNRADAAALAYTRQREIALLGDIAASSGKTSRGMEVDL